MRICNVLRASGLAGALLMTAALTQRAEGSIVMNISQAGSDVFVSGSGTVNLAALTLLLTNTSVGALIPTAGVATAGPAGASIDHYVSVSGPANFGSGLLITQSSGSGDFFGISGFGGQVIVPHGYTSGPLSGSSTFDNATISSLGMTPGTYVWTWGTGPTADSFTLNIAPEPGSFSLLAVGLLFAGLRMRRRARASI